MSVYDYYNNRIIDDFDNNYTNINLFPTCFSSLFICSYYLNLEIAFDSFFYKKEMISIPIELYTPLKIEDLENNYNKINLINNIKEISDNNNKISIFTN